MSTLIISHVTQICQYQGNNNKEKIRNCNKKWSCVSICSDKVNDELKKCVGMSIGIVVSLRVSSRFNDCNENDDIREKHCRRER